MSRVLVVFIPSVLFAEGSQQPNPVASLLPFILMGLVIWLIVRRARRRPKHSKLSDAQRQRPPTDRQMAYIDALIDERDVAPWILEFEPETIEEASILIDELKKQPIRQGDMLL